MKRDITNEKGPVTREQRPNTHKKRLITCQTR